MRHIYIHRVVLMGTSLDRNQAFFAKRVPPKLIEVNDDTPQPLSEQDYPIVCAVQLLKAST